jgi:hypothetical protein
VLLPHPSRPSKVMNFPRCDDTERIIAFGMVLFFRVPA